jgi:hypothetical protein
MLESVATTWSAVHRRRFVDPAGRVDLVTDLADLMAVVPRERVLRVVTNAS